MVTQGAHEHGERCTPESRYLPQRVPLTRELASFQNALGGTELFDPQGFIRRAGAIRLVLTSSPVSTPALCGFDSPATTNRITTHE